MMMAMAVVMKWRKSAMEKADREEKVPKSRLRGGGADATSSMQLGPTNGMHVIRATYKQTLQLKFPGDVAMCILAHIIRL